MRKFISAIIFALLASTASAQNAPFVGDRAGLLKGEELASVTSQAVAITTETGVNVGVVTYTQLTEEPKQTTCRTIVDWGMGNRSVLLMISVSPRQIWLQPGPDMSSQFDVATASAICRNQIAPYMREGKPFAAVTAGLEAIKTRLTTAPIPAPIATASGNVAETSGFNWGKFLVYACIVVAGIIVVVLIFNWICSDSGPSRNSYRSDYAGGVARGSSSDRSYPSVGYYDMSSHVSYGGSSDTSQSGSSHGSSSSGSSSSSSSSSGASSGGGSSYDSSSSSSSYDSGSSCSFDGGGGGSSY